RIFEQFFRLDSSRSSSTGGSGLGLAISKQLAEAHGGAISAESSDEIIRFTVKLPLDRKKIV
ncbi:MAG: ATP-binding protein, partial [Ruminococcus flavefaciens]|nr:ATP-binding protein [Ruminococcus flavefaciens]